jgi:hypothetical protein
MLEIMALYFLCKRMGEKLRAKGWKTTVWMQIAVVLAWFGGMLFGSVSYRIYLGITKGEAAAESPGFIVYPIAILTGAAAVGTLFLIASALSNKLPPALPESHGSA